MQGIGHSEALENGKGCVEQIAGERLSNAIYLTEYKHVILIWITSVSEFPVVSSCSTWPGCHLLCHVGDH